MALPYTLPLTNSFVTTGADGNAVWTATVPAARVRGTSDTSLSASLVFQQIRIVVDIFDASERFTAELERASCLIQDTDGTTIYGPIRLVDEYSSNSYNWVLSSADAIAILDSATTLQLHFIEPAVEFSGRGSAAVDGSASLAVNRPVQGRGSAAVDGSATARITLDVHGRGSAAVDGFAGALINYPVTGRGTAAVDGSAELNIRNPLTGRGSAAVDGSATLDETTASPVAISARGSAAVDGSGQLLVSVGFYGRGFADVSGSATLEVSLPDAVQFSGRGSAAVDSGLNRLEGVEAGDIEFDSARGSAAVDGSATLDVRPPAAVSFSGRGSARMRDGGAAARRLDIVEPGRIPYGGRGSAAVDGFATARASQLLPIPTSRGSAAVDGHAALQSVVVDHEVVATAGLRSLHGDAPVFAMEIQHSSLTSPVRIVADNRQHRIGGDIYLPLAFRAQPPSFVEGEIPRATIEVDNVGRELMQWIEASNGGRGATMRIMMVQSEIGENSNIIWELPALAIGVTDITPEKVTINLVYRSGRRRPGIKWAFNRETAPGLFVG